MARPLRSLSATGTARGFQCIGARIFERFIKNLVGGLLLAVLTTALFCVGADGLPLANGVPSSPPPSGSPSPTVNPNPSGNSGSPIPSVGPSVLPVPSPPKRPHEAPPVKMTTPPFSPPAARPSTVPPDMLWLSQADVITVPLQTFSQ